MERGQIASLAYGESGRRTAVVERRYIGGSCLSINCLPSKNEIWSAKVAHLVRHAAQSGTVTGPVAIDMAKVRQRKREMVATEIAAHLENYKTSDTELIMGTGRSVAPKTLGSSETPFSRTQRWPKGLVRSFRMCRQWPIR